MTAKKKIVIVALSDLSRDPRVNRQIDTFKPNWEVTVLGLTPPVHEGTIFHQIILKPFTLWHKIRKAVGLKCRQFEKVYWNDFEPESVNSIKHAIGDVMFDKVIANDVESLPFVFELFPKTAVFLDAHEYTPRHFEDLWKWRFFFQAFKQYICKTYIPRCEKMSAVCDGIAREYEKNYKVPATVVLNASPYRPNIPVRPTDPKQIRLIHHGISNRSRHLEDMVNMVKHLDDRYALDLMLVCNDPTYTQTLRRLVDQTPRVQIIPAVAHQEIVPFISQYDIGIFMLRPINFNYEHGLPNKFFEFVQARLAVGIGPSIEMVKFIDEYKFGIYSATFDGVDLAKTLNKLSVEEIDTMKQYSDVAAKKLNAETVMAHMLQAVDSSEI